MTAVDIATKMMNQYQGDAEDYANKARLSLNERDVARFDGISTACSAIVSDLRRLIDEGEFDTSLCHVLGVEPGQWFLWEGYTLRVSPEGDCVQKKITTAPNWLGLEGIMVCKLINNVDKIMRMKEGDPSPRFSYYET